MSLPQSTQQVVTVLLTAAIAMVVGSATIRQAIGEPQSGSAALPAIATPMSLAATSSAPFTARVSAIDGAAYPEVPSEMGQFLNIPLADASILQRMGTLNAIREYLLAERRQRGEAIPATVTANDAAMMKAWKAGDYLALAASVQSSVDLLLPSGQTADQFLAARWADDSIVNFIELYAKDQRDTLKNRLDQANDLLKARYGDELDLLAIQNPSAYDLALEARASFDKADYRNGWKQTRALFTQLTGDSKGWEQWESEAARKGEMRVDVLGHGDMFLGGLARLEQHDGNGLAGSATFAQARSAWQSGKFATAYSALDRALGTVPAAAQQDAAGIREMLFATSFGEVLVAMKTAESAVTHVMTEIQASGDPALAQERATALKSALGLLIAGHVESSVQAFTTLEG
ncbi:MAG: hypothetical protein ABI743_05695 [bacterium]